jgi:hypothetical protein
MIVFGFSAIISWWICEKIIDFLPRVLGLVIAVLAAVFCGFIIAPAINVGFGYLSFPEVNVVELIIGSWSLHALPVAVLGIWSGIRQFRMLRKKAPLKKTPTVKKGALVRMSEKFQKLHISTRALIVTSGAWIILWQTFILGFSPFEYSFWDDSYMNDSRLKILATTFFPVLSLCVIYLAYHLIVQPNKIRKSLDKLDID